MRESGVIMDRPRAWHDRPAHAVLHGLATTPDGLSQVEAENRLKQQGANRLPEPPRRSALMRLLLQFHNILIYVLLGAAVITALLNHLVDTLVIVAVVIANAVIGFLQEGKAEKAMDAIRLMLAPRASVLRGGERRSVDGETLVQGDIVLLEAGDKVPADLRLIQARGLQVQEAILTGESVPVEKHTPPVAANAPVADRSCMTFSGTLVTAGQGRGVVVGTGAATEIGRISGLISAVETLSTPLVTQMGVFSRWLTFLILLIALLLLVFGYFVGHHDFTEMFMAVVGLSVAAIPEGLPAVLTITLAVGVQAMARRNAIVRRLPKRSARYP
jgi:P-type E1-E2 ATPase